MARKALATIAFAAVVVFTGSVALTHAAAAQTGQTLGSVTLPRAVMANGESLPAGTYTVRVSTQAVPAAVGLSSESSTWLEFVRGDQVRGRELASVLSDADVIQQVVESAPPARGSSKVEMLKGNDYMRVWINAGGTHYLVHFAVAPR